MCQARSPPPKKRSVVAPAGATELAKVESAPLADIAERILDVSDNEGAEVIGHQVGVAVSVRSPGPW